MATQSVDTGSSGAVGFATGLLGLVNNESGPGAEQPARNQINVIQSALTQQQTALQAEYAKLESALALSQSQESSLASDVARLPQKCPHAQLPGSRADHEGAAMRSGPIRAAPPADTTSTNLADSPQAHLAQLCASGDAIHR